MYAIRSYYVKGIVTDDITGEPLPGVTIVIKGSTNGTISGVMGDYSLMAPRGAVLVYSFVGRNNFV